MFQTRSRQTPGFSRFDFPVRLRYACILFVLSHPPSHVPFRRAIPSVPWDRGARSDGDIGVCAVFLLLHLVFHSLCTPPTPERSGREDDMTFLRCAVLIILSTGFSAACVFVSVDERLICHLSVWSGASCREQARLSTFDMATYSSGHHAIPHGFPRGGQLDQDSSHGECCPCAQARVLLGMAQNHFCRGGYPSQSRSSGEESGVSNIGRILFGKHADVCVSSQVLLRQRARAKAL